MALWPDRAGKEKYFRAGEQPSPSTPSTGIPSPGVCRLKPEIDDQARSAPRRLITEQTARL